MNKTDAIKQFLESQENASPVARLYTCDMEVQVNVKLGKPVKNQSNIGKRFQVYTDGENTWKPFRIPWGSKNEPTYEDGPLTYSLELYAQAIGMTGWNWADQKSQWVGFDFDSIVNHTKGLTQDELKTIYNRLLAVDWVTIYSSTSGLGYHIYVFIENSPVIKNHTDHAALSRAVLSKLSGLCSFELTEKVDVCGGILWVWKDTANGFNLLKHGTPLDANTIYDWQDHREATKLRGKRKLPTTAYETLNQSVRRIELDEDHIRLLKWLEEKGKLHWWDADHWMLVCHTHDLKEAYNELNFAGIYTTTATGKDL